MSRSIGRRRRRLYWTAGILIVVAAVGSAIGYSAYRSSRQETYRPGEDLEAITRKLDLGIPEGAPRPQLVDVTLEVGLGDFRSFRGERTSQLPEDMGPGAAWGDIDRDGDDDLFIVAQGGPIGAPEEERERSRLYENRGDGTFAEVSGFPETRIIGMGAAFGDYDGDGWLDLVVTGYGALRLYRNERGRFVLDSAIEERPGFWAGASWGDFDLDGDLDLYVCGYVRYVEDPLGGINTTQQYGRAVPYTLNPASFEPERNLLFRNEGGGRFKEVAVELGVENPSGRSLGALWHDLDEDGRPDLYVANDISDNALLMNRSGGFEDQSHPAWVADYRGAMGMAVGDWNRDGDDDLFITHWIAQENALYDSLRLDLAKDGEESPLRFMDVADQRGLGQVALQLIGWGTEFVDLDSDGWLDLAVANGSTFETDEVPRGLRAQAPFLFWSNRGESFHDLAPLNRALATPHVSRGLAVSDYDLDGDQDLLFVDRDAGVRLFRNEMPQGSRVGIRLVPAAGGFIEGAQIQATVAGGSVRGQPGGVSYLSQNSAVVHLGLGSAERIERLEIRWPDGATQSFDDVEANALWNVEHGAARPVQVKSWRGAEADAASSRQQLGEFWRLQREAMNAFKVDRDLPRAMELFRQALAIDPGHEDSLYYLGNCLAETGDVDGALEQFARIMGANTQSHRAYKRWGTLRAVTARNRAELDAAVEVLQQAVAINPEETGVSLVLGEVHLMRGEPIEARRYLEAVVRSNSQSGEAYWVLAYLASQSGDAAESERLLELARGTRAEDWKPAGAVAEGEVRKKMHTESTPFGDQYRSWDGKSQPTIRL